MFRFWIAVPVTADADQGFQPEVALLLERLHDHFVQFNIADLRRIFFYLFPSCRIGEAEQYREVV